MAQFWVEIKIAFRDLIEAPATSDAGVVLGDRIREAMSAVDLPWGMTDIEVHRVSVEEHPPHPKDGAN